MKRILDAISSPRDLKLLSDTELGILADEIRQEIISVTSKNGGHVASSLGAVEIILAVHSLIDTPKDKFVFDVGHQAYAHKILTGRREDVWRNLGIPAPRRKPVRRASVRARFRFAIDCVGVGEGARTAPL